MKESGWKETAENKTSHALGIPQAYPASKLDTYGDRKKPETQIRWFINYVEERYSTPCNALQFWLRQSPHWY